MGAVCALVAVVLVRLIGFFSNLFFYHRINFDLTSPAGHHLGAWMVLVPTLGGLVIGLMARYGSDRIRGHGIPEALEAILFGKSRMSAKVAVLKPLSSALSIGSGGPFGAEGPIIMTGGAVGSLIAQAFNLTGAERKTLLVAGAAGGMSAIFGTPMAAVLLAVELLLFEWKPRSLVPVALASIVAAALRPFFLGQGPLFPVPAHPPLGPEGLLLSAGVGLTAGILSAGLTMLVYAFEDIFTRLPIHWMWWPTIGGFVVGVGGLFQPRALGVGYDVIADLLNGNFLPQALVGLLVVKCVIWAVSLGSGTSGGVLAPLLIMGGALGSLEAFFMHDGTKTLWPLIGMAAVLGGTMRSPLTSVVFALELTRDTNAMLPLLTAGVVAHAFTVLVMKRSILTEKVARRGYHLMREYTVDPLDLIDVGSVMTRQVDTVEPGMAVQRLLEDFFSRRIQHKHQGYPVIDDQKQLLGIVTRSNVLQDPPDSQTVEGIMEREVITVTPQETCRTAVERMAQCGVGRLVVVSADNPREVVGIVTRSDVIKPRALAAADELALEKFIELPDLSGWPQSKKYDWPIST